MHTAIVYRSASSEALSADWVVLKLLWASITSIMKMSFQEGIRLAYLLQSLRSSNIRDPYTQRREPDVIPLRRRLPTILASGVTVIFFVGWLLPWSIDAYLRFIFVRFSAFRSFTFPADFYLKTIPLMSFDLSYLSLILPLLGHYDSFIL